ncbi:MAG: hypothetical protein JHC26_11680, partial [Thermofilum sp.]|uniref:hypothetical protein n=1 Tax=Thermofilum sp. TaxID=1961369 RepID=UPI002589A0D2
MALDFELLRKEYQEAIAQQATDEYWVPEFGENLIRVLPPRDGKLFYKKVGVHFKLVGSGMEFCPRITEGLPCPVCEVVDQLRKMKTPVATQLVNRLAVVERFLMNIIPLKDGEEKSIRQYLAPKTVRVALLKTVLDPDYGDITDLVSGRNVVIEKVQGSGGFVNYSVRVKPREVPLRDLLGRELRIEEIPDLNEFVSKRLKGYDALKNILYGGDEDLGVEGLMERYSSSGSVEDGVKEEKGGVDEAVDAGVVKQKGGQVDVEEMLKMAKKIAQQLKD